MCGEKHAVPVSAIWSAGSPPRVRGKASCILVSSSTVGITPAYAGKRCPRDRGAGQNQDHPRVCGEKFGMIGVIWPVSGSPPRVRGKGTDGAAEHGLYGITPAYAGKSRGRWQGRQRCRDHPRVCGEKHHPTPSSAGPRGSPPRMRGKEPSRLSFFAFAGITPAYAGKSDQG